MELGFVGLGRMGMGMVLRLLSGGHRVTVYDVEAARVDEAAAIGATAASSVEELARLLNPPRTIWVMVPAGSAVDEVIFEGLLPYVQAGDLVIDGGNSHHKDSMRRALALQEKGIHFLDVGTSGGLEGVKNGLAIMVGGEREAFERARPIFETLAAPNGYGYVGGAGAGHFVKTVHNGIEYAILQAYGEGFDLLRQGPFPLDLADVARIWNNGSVVRSWLLELAQRALEKDPTLQEIAPEVGGGETGKWALEAALESEVPFSTLALALAMRFRSRQADSFAAKLIAALRW